ncbi:MAG: ATP-binding cassette domain-containing protein [Candidatus Aquicultor sp.]|nr:ATP-binding cassette domain-containing protein [Candidatus Aquicultor sp.]
MLELIDISLAFNDNALFSDVSLAVNAGDLVIIGGPSGSGKSSLLRLLNRLNDPTSGQINLDGRPFTDYKVVELRRQICYIQQTPVIVEGTVKQNLLLPFGFESLRGFKTPTDETLIDLLHKFKLDDIALSDQAMVLSVGQKQRLAFIRALLLQPKALLLDEPTSALDQDSRLVVEEYVKRLAGEENLAILMVTHLDFKPKHMKARPYMLKRSGLEERAG